MNSNPTFGPLRCNTRLFDHSPNLPNIDKSCVKKEFRKIKDGLCRKSSKIINKLCGSDCQNNCETDFYNDDRIIYVKEPTFNRICEVQRYEPCYEEQDFFHERDEYDDFCTDCCSNVLQHFTDDHYDGRVFT